jgi:hypothetical protein
MLTGTRQHRRSSTWTAHPLPCPTYQVRIVLERYTRHKQPCPAGKHSYFFVFSDALSSWGDPVGPQVYAGPTIGATAGTQVVTPGTVIGDPGDSD